MRLLLLIVCYLAAAWVSAEEVQGESESVSLRFGWKPGMTARVESRKSRVRIIDGKEVSSNYRSHGWYRVHVEQTKDGLLIRYSDPEVAQPTGALTGQSRGADTLVQQLALVMPSYVVDSEGQFVRIENLTQMRNELRQLFSPMLEGGPPELEQMRVLMDSAMSEEALTASAMQEWNMLVGVWAGADFEPGAVYGGSTEEPVPALQGVMVPIQYEFELVRRLPCTEKSAVPQCVMLRMSSAPDPDAVRQVIEEFLGRFPISEKSQGEAFERLEVMNTLVVITEPDTLRPHRLHLEKRTSGTVRDAKGSRQEVSQLEEQETSFTYIGR